MAWLRGLGFIMCVALAACSSEDRRPATDSVGSAIYYGAPESGEAWAVAVYYTRPGTTKLRLCTGALISPRAVLTAKHCTFDEVSPDVWQALAPSQLSAAVGTDMTAPMQQEVGVIGLKTTPGDYTKADALGGLDIAVLLLDAALSVPVKPVSSLPPQTGDPLKLVGFGFTENDVLGKKHSGATSVSDVNSGVFQSAGPAWTCSGDSGGPALHTTRGEVLGVSSYGPSGCNVPDSYYTRVDVHAALIADAIAASGGGGAGGAGGAGGCTPSQEVCDGVDNDCDGLIDPGCGPTACDAQSPCSAGLECVAGQCVSPPGTPAQPNAAGSSDTGGCAMRSRAPNSSLLLLVFCGALAMRRRRARHG